MDTTHPGLDEVVDTAQNAVEDGVRRASEFGPDAFEDPAAADRGQLRANAEARVKLRSRADKAELNLAMRDLSEGTRGLIRVAPFTAVVVGVAIGMMFGRRRAKVRRPAPPRRR